MAFAGAEVTQAAAPRSAWRGWVLDAYRDLAARLEAYPLERVGLAAIMAGIVLRVAAPFFMDFRADGDTYTAMGHAWALHGEFLMPYGDVSTWGPLPPGHSNHYPPAYPFYLGVVFTLFGFGLWQAKWAAVVVAVAALGVVYLCTRDLYGRVPAALATGLLALEPHLVWVTGTGFSENMVLLFFALTMWAILKSLTDDRYIVLAGLFAGLAYLSRASVGYFFVVAGAGGFLWRLTFRGWSVLANRWYLAAIAVFGTIILSWAGRNVALFGWATQTRPGEALVGQASILLLVAGVVVTLPFLARRPMRTLPNLAPGLALLAAGVILPVLAVALRSLNADGGLLAKQWVLSIPRWETSSYTRYVQNYALERTDLWAHALVRKIPFFVAFLAWYVVAFLPESWRAARRFRDERTSALWLSVFLVWVIAWAISSMFWVFEQSSLYWFDNHRYVVIGLLPLAWLLLREARLERASTRLRVILLTLSLFAASGAVFTDPIRYSDLRAAEFMDGYLREGDEVAVDGGTIKYAFYPYLTHPEQVRIYGCEAFTDVATRSGPCHGEADAEGNQADFILTLRNSTYQGYAWVGDFKQRYSDGGVMTATLYARDDVVRERGIPTGFVREW